MLNQLLIQIIYSQMQNKNFLYRVVPRRMQPEQKLTQPFKKVPLCRQGAKSANFFENCYIFIEPTFYTKPQTKKLRSGDTNFVSKTAKTKQNAQTANNKVLTPYKSDFLVNKINQVKDLSKNTSFCLETIHSRRKYRSFSAKFNQKQKFEYETTKKKLEINAFSCDKYVKKVSLSNRSSQLCKTQRKKAFSRVQKVLQIYPQQSLIEENSPTKCKDFLMRQSGKQMKDTIYRPWSPDKRMPSTIQIGQGLQTFFGFPL